MTVALDEAASEAARPQTKRKARGPSDARRGLTLMSPVFGYALLLLAIPLGATIAMSFWSQDFLTFDRSGTLENYAAIWTDDMPDHWTGIFGSYWTENLYRALLLRSLSVSLFVTAATLLLAFPIAYYVSFHVRKNKGLWIFLITIPFWTSYLLRVFLWKVILGYEGVVNASLMALGVIDEPLTSINYSINAVVLTLAHAWAPFAILPIFVSLEKIDRSLLEAAEDLGDGPIRRFFRVTLPLAMPGVVAAALIVFIPTIGDYVTPKLLGGKDGLMISNMIEVQFKKGNDQPLGSALAVSSMMIVASISVLFVWMNRKYLRARPS